LLPIWHLQETNSARLEMHPTFTILMHPSEMAWQDAKSVKSDERRGSVIRSNHTRWL